MVMVMVLVVMVMVMVMVTGGDGRCKVNDGSDGMFMRVVLCW